jgi:vitamin K-dependent gamma-carboxylase
MLYPTELRAQLAAARPLQGCCSAGQKSTPSSISRVVRRFFVNLCRRNGVDRFSPRLQHQKRPRHQPKRSVASPAVAEKKVRKQRPAQSVWNWARFKDLLAQPVNAASLAVFRICVGIVMALEAYSLFRPNVSAISAGTSPLETYYAGPDINFNFPYAGFGWLPFLPAAGMYAMAVALGVAGIFTALGLFYRVSSAVLFGAWGYFFLIESTRTYWQSHYYLEFLTTFLLVWMPAARRWSLDAALGRAGPIRTVPFWTLVVLRGQLVIAYFYAGVAKINLDWLADAVPVRWFLKVPTVLGPYEKILPAGMFRVMHDVVLSPAFAYFLSYTGLIFDCAIGFLLLCRRTRIFGLILMLIFHATNHFLIFDDISWFPLLGFTTALIFLDADWPERVGQWFRNRTFRKPDWKWFGIGGVVFPVVGAALGWKLHATETADAQPLKLSKWTPRLVALWLVTQALIPMRHYFIPGDGRFTYEGLSFSWRLKTDVRNAGAHQLYIRDSTIVNPNGRGIAAVNWSEWRGAKAVYLRVTPGHIDWNAMPEFALSVEPFLGERVIFNPIAGKISDEVVARQAVNEIWRKRFGKEPQNVQVVRPLDQTLSAAANAMKAAGREDYAQILELAERCKELPKLALSAPESVRIITDLRQIVKKFGDDATVPKEVAMALRGLPPFALEGQRFGGEPFFIVDDPDVVELGKKLPFRVKMENWNRAIGDAPAIAMIGDLGRQGRELMPQAYLMASVNYPSSPPAIWWNSAKDLTPSKFNHVSNQAFYLRRYAQRVASLWEKQYGRRPVINAYTQVSFNNRPNQQLVDPKADLASVGVTYFGHNPWIRDLETKRIPREAVENGNLY